MEIDQHILLDIKEEHPLKAYLKLVEEKKVPRRLSGIYDSIPMNNCKRCTDCCLDTPEVFFIEFINILKYLSDNFSKEEKDKVAQKLVNDELTSLISEDRRCAFLDGNNCIIYERRPIQCRLPPFHSKQDYEETKAARLKRNTELQRFYCVSHDLKLPEELRKSLDRVAEPCGNNLDSQNRPLIMAKPEKNMIFGKILDLQNETIPYQLDDTDAYNRLTYLFSQIYLTDNEIDELILKAAKEYLKDKSSSSDDQMVQEIKFVDI